MALKSFTLTLTGSVQQLSSGLTAGEFDMPVVSVDLQADPANANAIYVGDSAITSSDYGVRIAVPVTNVPDPPYPLGGGSKGNLRLQDIYVLGTNTQKIHVNLVY